LIDSWTVVISKKYMFGGQNSGTAFGKIVRVTGLE